MRAALVIIFIFFTNTSLLQAQDSLSLKKFNLTCKPLGLINPITTNATAGIMVQLQKKLYAEIQAGYIYSFRISDYTIYNMKYNSGFKINTELKYFVLPDVYIGAQLFWNNYSRFENRFFTRQGGSYSELYLMQKQINTLVGHLKFGYLVILPSSNFFIDLFVAAGLRYKDVYVVKNNTPEDMGDLIGADLILGINNEGTHIYPSAIFGVGLGYKLSWGTSR